MEPDTTPPFAPAPPGPDPAARGSRWPRRVGALAGVAVLSAAVIGFGAAGAQTADGEDSAPPVVVHSGVVSAGPLGSDEMTAFDECLAEALPDDGFMMKELPVEPTDAEFEAALEGCERHLSDEERAEMARWDDFEACMDEALGDGETALDAIAPGDEPDEAIFDELDARFEAAEEACRDQLPDDLQAEMEAWKDFDGCIESQFEHLGPLVTIDGDDGLSLGQFGEGAGTITVTKAAGGTISVEANGSATVSDEPGPEGDPFFPDETACEHLAPEDAEA